MPANRSPDLLETIAAHFDLGGIKAPPVERHGGINTLWRLQTNRGEFAVHEMAVVADGVDPSVRCERAYALEMAAASAGVKIALPAADPQTGKACAWFRGLVGPVVVHAWVDADPVRLGRTRIRTYEILGRSLAGIHGLEPDIDPASPDPLERHPTADEWRELADEGERLGSPWAQSIKTSADELADALAIVDEWDWAAGEAQVISHRDLTSANILDDAGIPALIDWEDAGLIAPGSEVGRTALDNFACDGVLDAAALRAFLAGYGSARPLPTVGSHWCSLWVRGLILFAEHCARSCVSGTTPRLLRERQSAVVENTVAELRRRLHLTDALVAAFESAVPADLSTSG
ncbi:MAG TPA: phosphotransferase [Acidimicrobiales bacterium]|nr:phosphotransferase [Acidimicrobiales bacterium]